MPIYRYIAKNAEGKTKSGSMQSANLKELAQELKNQEMVLVKADPDNATKGFSFKFSLFRPRVSTADKLMITKNLQVMVATGLPLVRAFTLLSGQAKNKSTRKALLDIKNEISKGESLANSLGEYSEIFSEIFRNMISVGEASGTLENVLQILSLQIEKEHQLNSKVRRALIYPAVLLSVMLVVGTIVMTVFVPGLKSLFAGLNVELPIYTKIFIGTGDFMMEYWYFVLLFLVLLVLIVLKGLKTKKGKWIRDAILINLPVVSALVKKTNSASFIRSLSSLISSGVSLVESLEITSRTLSNWYFEKALKEVAEKIKKGEELHGALLPYKNIFPFGALETIEVGEETGETAAILKKLADFYEEQVMDAMDNLSVLIEPVMIIILGVAVAIFAFSVLSPLYSVLATIH